MRFAPVSLALSLALACAASSGLSAPAQPLDPRAALLLAQGQRALAAGDLDTAQDGFEAALALQPGSDRITTALADVARRQGMAGKALHYYRLVLAHSPNDTDAMAGEGEALAEKGAIEKARLSLVRVTGVCGGACDAARRLSVAITAAEARATMAAKTPADAGAMPVGRAADTSVKTQ
jgi:Tfp pilus assembly protein PilF